ncbi:MAG: glycosyltransferase family 2 protein [Alphaproteobacteria bacterium]|nr:glycosyltransferase family 2 protein [Alphaproteobacteria bacterium]TAD89643.1 MAG: glycosyltransferase family 2 protein [Alphaproteobacteria bacterium]
MTAAPRLSVVVPVLNEAENVSPLIDQIRRAVPALGSYEIVFVDDGSTDGTVAALLAAQTEGDLRVVRHRQRCGQSAALLTGVRAARGDYIVTLDGDGQNDPADIPALWQAAEAHQANSAVPFLVCGWRKDRKDTWLKRRSSRIANAIRRNALKDNTQDTGCSLKLYRRDFFLRFPHYDHNHRFLCALAIREGGVVLSVPVSHRPRTHGVSKYGFWDRLWVGIDDLWGTAWLMRRMRRPDLLPPDTID